MVACTKAKTNCTRDLEKSVEASYIWLDSCVRGREGRLQTGCLFISALIDQERCLSCHRARDIQLSWLTSQSGKSRFLFLVSRFNWKLLCNTFSLQNVLFREKLVKSTSISHWCSWKLKTGFGKLKNGTKTELDEIPGINCAENAAKCQKLC